ncbi:MAG: ATP-binding protein [Candidatus Thorarchaeota archaeon]
MPSVADSFSCVFSGITHIQFTLVSYLPTADSVRPLELKSFLDGISSTADIPINRDPLQRIIGQEQAVDLVRSAVIQRRHMLLCGVPGVGKSMIARAAYTLLPPPKEEICLQRNPLSNDRPKVVIIPIVNAFPEREIPRKPPDVRYVRPEMLPFDVGVKMGFRCPKCGTTSLPSQNTCIDCSAPKRSDWGETGAFHGLLHELDVITEPALTSVSATEVIEGEEMTITYRRAFGDTVMMVYEENDEPEKNAASGEEEGLRVLVSRESSRFIHVSGASPVEILGDVKHDPYGSAESLGMPSHHRVVPGAIHEAHEGILYIDEIASLGDYQKHLLTAMQERKFSISGHNPNSSGAAVRVDDVPCDFLLFAACNIEDLQRIISPLRSRIRGYGYEVMLNSYMPKKDENIEGILRFIAQTVEEDGRIPHFSLEAADAIVKVAEELAFRFDGARNSLTLRLRELGGIIRIAGDIAAQDAETLVLQKHVVDAEVLSRGIEIGDNMILRARELSNSYGDYFF